MNRRTYALVTGASHGLGKFFAAAPAARKRNLVIISRSRDQLQKVASELKTAHEIEVVALPFDLSAPKAGCVLITKAKRSSEKTSLVANNLMRT